MELSIKSLKSSGSFTGAPVEKEIKWEQNGEECTATTYVRKLSYRSAVSDVKNYYGDMAAGRIASCICDKDGNPVFTVSDITGNPEDYSGKDEKIIKRNKEIIERGPLDHNLTVALLNAIAEVNNFTGKKKT